MRNSKEIGETDAQHDRCENVGNYSLCDADKLSHIINLIVNLSIMSLCEEIQFVSQQDSD